MISFNEINTSSVVPRFLAEFDLKSGVGGKAESERSVYVLAPMNVATNSGTLTIDKPSTEPFVSFDAVQEAYGEGSLGAYMVSFLMRNAKHTPIYGIGLDESAGNKASGTITFAEESTASGECKIAICGEVVSIFVPSGSTPTETGDLLVEAFDDIHDSLKPPVSLTNSTGTVTVEANNEGTWGNEVTLVVKKFSPETQTCTLSGDKLTTGSGDVALTSALENIRAVHTPYLVYHGKDETNLTAVKEHFKNKGDGEELLGGQWLACTTGSYASSVSLADSVDSDDAERGILVAYRDSESLPGAIASATVGQIANMNDVARPVNGLILRGIKPSDNEYTNTEANLLLKAGITPIRDSRIIRAVSLRTDIQTPLDHTKIATLDLFRERVLNRLKAKFQGFKVKATSGEVHSSFCTTPSAILDQVKDVAVRMEKDEDLLQGVEELKDSFSVEYMGNGQVRWVAPAYVIDGLHLIYGSIQLITSL